MATIQSQPAPYIMPTTYPPAPAVTDHRRYSISSAVTSPASPSPSAQLPAPSKPVRHVPHSPSFRQLPFAGMPRSASPVTSVQSQAPPAGQAYLPQQSQRYRMGHHRSEISLSASGRSVSMPVSSSSAYSSPSPSPTASSSSSAISHSRSNSVASTSSSSSPTVLDQTYTYNAPPTRPTLPYSNSFSHPHQQQQQQSHSPVYAPDQSYYQYQRQSMASASVPRSLSRASTAAYNMARTSSPVRQPISRPASVRSFSAPEEHSQLRYNSSSTSLSSMSSSPKPSSSSSSSSSTASRTRELSTASARQQHSRQPSTDSVATTVSTSSSSSKTHRRNPSSSTVSDYERKKALKNLETSPTDQDQLGPRFANDDKETKKKSRFKKMLSFIAPQQQSSSIPPVYGPPTPVSYIVTSTSTSPVSTKSMNASIPAPSPTLSHDSRRSSRAVESVDVMEYNFLNESIYKKQATAGSQQEVEDDDNTSIRSTASSVSKALRRFSTGLSSRRPSKVSSMSSLNNGSSSNSSSTASSVRDSVVLVDEGEDDDDASQYETVRMYEPVKNPSVIPKSILKNPHQGQQVPTPSVSPAASDASDSSDSTSSGMTQESFANSHSSSWTSLALSNNSTSPTCNEDSVKEAAKPSTTKEEGAAAATSVQFSPNIRIYSTWNSGEYDRKIPDPVPYHTFPMWMISQIKEEINNYKSNEMEIHEESKCFTCYY